MSPVISVIMPVYNSGRYLKDAVESILRQSFNDFEFIIIDDGSTDESSQILNGYASADSRVRVYTQSNQGTTLSLNYGLDIATGAYIARMDADDVSLPNRLQRQVAHMDMYPQIDICGTWVRTIGELAGQTWKYPIEHEAIRSFLVFGNPLAHPTVMIRSASFRAAKLRYDTTYRRAQDYELWVRTSKCLRLANLPEPLLQYRVHLKQASQHSREEQMQAAERIQRSLLSDLYLEPTAAELSLHEAISTSQFQPTLLFLLEAQAWLVKLRAANEVRKIYNEDSFAKMLVDFWYLACRGSASLGLPTFLAFWRSPLQAGIQPSPRRFFALLARCLRL